MILYSLSHCGHGYAHSQITVGEIFCTEMHLSYQWSRLRHWTLSSERGHSSEEHLTHKSTITAKSLLVQFVSIKA